MRETFTSGSVGRAPGNRCLYPEGDGEQRPLVPRSRCLPRLTPGVAMTSDVKSGQQIFLGLHTFSYPQCIGKVGARKRRRVSLRLSVGGVPPAVPPSGACLSLGTSSLRQAASRRRGFHHAGAASVPMHGGPLLRSGLSSP